MSSSPPSQTLRVWDFPTRTFHWLLVAAIAVAFLSSEEDSALAAWHQAAGWLAAVLILFRLVWGFVGGEHARFADFLRPGRLAAHLSVMLRGRPEAELGHNPLGGLAVAALLGLVAATVATGLIMLRGGEDDLHEVIGYGLLALIGVHVLAVVVMSLMTRENLIRAMVTGRKPADRHPGAQNARPAPLFALPLAALVVAAGVYGATLVDPLAFLPHNRAEVGEGGGHAAAGALERREAGETEDEDD
ncbi:MAG: cytochrome B [Phenylobacterium sp.]|uniref:cytochrome b/b6 domain-containing protein n=1 Tax=Phenylobacterium sp. TaxID=1871053 RepID=UPI0025D91C5D|nr:cytochrome b/b6 domain-containing protein [Phenylobacterium sp.]MBI1197455.1 cytochrome B [Phenylobacterium sp.]